ncbi:hypothetical protein LXL04_017346 [Taraxacum kok-saghyz]
MAVLSELLEESSSSSSSTHSQSSSTHGQSSSTDAYRYDIFLSFRGLDTRQSFIDHLHKALIDANISTFLDDEEIETGEDLKPELESAIKASRGSIIVLSKNYATSTWCLDELVMILEQRMTSNHIVIPIFYHVEPTNVRKQQGSFGDAMSKHKHTMEEETDAYKRSQLAQKMDRWNKALTQVANLKGNDANGRPETNFIEEIVMDIHRRIHFPLRRAQPPLLGMDCHINFITSWLKDASLHWADILTISGMGGIGKTHLAKHVYELHRYEFHTRSYIENISRRWDGNFNGLLDVQKQLYDEISKTSSIKVHDVSMYTSKIENVLARKRVLLVLDDIDSISQLDALLGSKGFHPGSKIIITTRNKRLIKNCTLFKTNNNPKHQNIFLQGLNEIESQQLLCFHAFTGNRRNVGYGEVLDKLLKYCQGHPLALEVLGKTLHNRDVSYWEGYIEGLKEETSSPINNVLRMSFNSLTSNNDKELFKYIACHLVGIDLHVAETILNACDIITSSGIINLIDRCLLRIGLRNELEMHQLVQEMGRWEVRQESPHRPWNQSQVWCHKESLKVLKRKMGKENIVGLALDMRMIEGEKLGASFELKTDALSNMDSLMLLQLNYVHMDGSYDKFPEELRCLCMHGFHLKFIPSDLPMKNLVALDLSHSNIESFVSCYRNTQRLAKRQKSDGLCRKDKRWLGSLKILNLSYCKQLHSLGDFDQLPALEMLIVRNCIRLVEVCESIKQCVELILIDLSYCNKLKRFPTTRGILKKVKTMLLDGCNIGESQIKIGDMDSRELCKANNLGTNTRTSSSSSAIVGDLKFFTNSLLSSLVTLSLTNSNLSTESFPMDFSCLSMLEYLYLDGNPMDSLPNCLRTLPRLAILSLQNCRKMKYVEHPPRTLKLLLLDSLRKPYVEKVVFDPDMSPLLFYSNPMYFPSCLYEIQGMIKIQPILDVEEKLLCSLGWTNLDFLNKMRNGTDSSHTGSKTSKIQMIYEFGIFSTMYKQEEMPSWFTLRSMGPSISFTIPSSSSSPNNLRGLNFCSVHTLILPYAYEDEYEDKYDQFPKTSMITISNVTKNRMWIYERYLDGSFQNCWIVLSHWMFGRTEMEGGDHVTITVTDKYNQLTKECGVSLVYDHEEEEEDILGYYKSWNHIIGGDLSHFQTTTGAYILNHHSYFSFGICLYPYHRQFIADGPDYQAKEMCCFRALSPSKPDIMQEYPDFKL